MKFCQRKHKFDFKMLLILSTNFIKYQKENFKKFIELSFKLINVSKLKRNKNDEKFNHKIEKTNFDKFIENFHFWKNKKREKKKKFIENFESIFDNIE
jgi:hypothetical protein